MGAGDRMPEAATPCALGVDSAEDNDSEATLPPALGVDVNITAGEETATTLGEVEAVAADAPTEGATAAGGGDVARVN